MIRKFIPIAGVVALVALAACAPSAPKSSGGSSSGSSTLTISTSSDIDNYNPLIGISATDRWINDLMYPTLMGMNSSGGLTPYVATSWGYTSPTQGYFNVRTGMKWSDGTALTADDVAWELNAILKYQPPGIVTGFVGNLKSATAVSPTRVVLNLSHPDSTLVPEVGFWMPIIPEHIWDKVGNIGKYVPTKNWVSAGPYRLTSAVTGQAYTLTRVTPYPFAPGGKPTFSTIIFKVYPNVNTELLALRSGAVDVVGDSVPPSEVSVLQKTPGVKVQLVPGLGYEFLTYNVTKPPLSNLLVREALAHAVNDATLRRVVLDGQGVSAGSVPIAPVLKQWVDPAISEYSFDPALSRSLLEQAGYKANSSGMFPLSFNVIYSLQDAVTSELVTLLRSEAAQAGITLKLQGLSQNTFLAQSAAGNFDIYAGEFLIENNPVIGMQLAFEPKGVNNFTFETNNQLMSYIDGAVSSDNATQEVNLIHQAAVLIHSQVYDNVLFMQNPAVAYSSKCSGWQVQPSELLSIISPESLANAKCTS